ncbi:MAG: HNH endonuclease [Nitrospinaceae bacterium]|nr:MAG: HNH endonuclease [Nitrospinaceae bacterium]
MFESIKILVLNYSYEPLQFCTAKRGLIMVLSGRAENLESNGYVVRSPSISYPLPAVIRTLKMIRRNRKRGVSFSKKNILRRDNYTCQYCGHSGSSSLTVDHVHPKSRGGGTNWTNVVVACKPCNLKKGNQTLVETGMKLISRPSQPDFLFSHFSVPQSPESFVEIWQKYLPAKIFKKSLIH